MPPSSSSSTRNHCHPTAVSPRQTTPSPRHPTPLTTTEPPSPSSAVTADATTFISPPQLTPTATPYTPHHHHHQRPPTAAAALQSIPPPSPQQTDICHVDVRCGGLWFGTPVKGRNTMWHDMICPVVISIGVMSLVQQ
ncbi:hypothetical protein Tco_0682601 [Tanacetum coccineum]|uniref:Uncharacterized protein n=1 Tax=Tanacetum coccineum TaxID=301880 RepID=A0ABQ4XS81_9ASTR